MQIGNMLDIYELKKNNVCYACRFCYLQTCGCVFSDRAMKEIKTEICHKVSNAGHFYSTIFITRR